MNTIPTRSPMPVLSPLMNAARARYLRWQLDNTEQDMRAYQQNEEIARGRAAELRVELARLGAL